MTLKKSLTITIQLIILILCLSTKSAVAETVVSTKDEDDIRYLLLFKALPHHQKKERNFYELAREITGFIDGRIFPPTGIVTNEEVRYNVLKIIKTKILKTTNSLQSPQSSRSSRYIIIYNPIYKICATDYSVSLKKSGGGNIHYTDCESERDYDFPVAHRRALDIVEVEFLTENILPEIWKNKRTLMKN